MSAIAHVTTSSSSEAGLSGYDSGELYERYAAPLYRFIFFRVGDHHVAEDLLHEVFVRALVALPQFEERGHPISAWLYRIAACRVTDWRRASGRRQLTSLEHVSELAGADSLEAVVEQAAQQHDLAVAIGQLSERQAAVIRLRFARGLSVVAAAAHLGLTPGAVKALQHRALAQLRCQLAQHGSYHAA